jgi:isoquinoline 1-oxidoreductase beta subunit
VRSDREPGGAGEASVPPVAPALASAIHAATGERPRRLPLVEAGFEIG